MRGQGAAYFKRETRSEERGKNCAGRRTIEKGELYVVDVADVNRTSN